MPVPTHRMRNIVASYHEPELVASDATNKPEQQPESKSNTSPAPSLICQEQHRMDLEQSSSIGQAVSPSAKDKHSIISYTSTQAALKSGISVCKLDHPSSDAADMLVNAPKSDEEELLNRLVQCEGVLGFKNQDQNQNATVQRVRC